MTIGLFEPDTKLPYPVLVEPGHELMNKKENKMSVLIPMSNQIFSQEKAVEIAAKLNADKEDDWTYIVENNPEKNAKTAIIRIYDCDNEYVGLL